MTSSHELEGELSLAAASARDIDVLLPMMDVFNAGESIAIEAEGLRRALGRLLADERLGRVWLIQWQSETVGYAVLTFGYDLEFAGRDAFITELFLRPDARGKRLGRLALARVEAAAADLGVRAIHLMVRPENQAAVALYASAGYRSPPRVFLSKILAGMLG
jgi:GNAT superfamily N-acetyltransferase